MWALNYAFQIHFFKKTKCCPGANWTLATLSQNLLSQSNQSVWASASQSESPFELLGLNASGVQSHGSDRLMAPWWRFLSKCFISVIRKTAHLCRSPWAKLKLMETGMGRRAMLCWPLVLLLPCQKAEVVLRLDCAGVCACGSKSQRRDP